MTVVEESRSALHLKLLTAAAVVWGVLLVMRLMVVWEVSPDMGHGWAVPLLIGYLYWERWAERPALRESPRVSGLSWAWLVVAGVLIVPIRLLLSPFPLWPAMVFVYVALWATLLLLGAWMLGGWRWVRWVGMPLTILLAAVPWPFQVERFIIEPLRFQIAALAAEIINLTGSPAIASGTTVRIAAGWVGVDEACGGIRSLQATTMTALFFGEWLRLTWSRRLGLLGVGVVAAVVGNFLRIMFLAWRAQRGESAVLEAHDMAGWMALLLSLALTGACAWYWSKASQPIVINRPADKPAARAALTYWGLAGAGALLLIEAGSFLWFSTGSTAVSEAPRWTVRFPVQQPKFETKPLEDTARDMLRPDYYAAATWRSKPTELTGVYYIEWTKGQTARFMPFLHNPTICMPFSGCELVRDLPSFTVKWSGGELPFKSYLFRRAGETFAVAFTVWDPRTGAPLKETAPSTGIMEFYAGRWEIVRQRELNQAAQLLSISVFSGDPVVTMQATLDRMIVDQSLVPSAFTQK